MHYLGELIAVFVIYGTVRLAVRHGMLDAWKRQRREEANSSEDGRSDE